MTREATQAPGAEVAELDVDYPCDCEAPEECESCALRDGCQERPQEDDDD